MDALKALELLSPLWPYLATALTVLLSSASSAHVVLRKRDSRAAISWVGLVWLVPIIGAVLYLLLGVNRIRRKAKSFHLTRHPAGGQGTPPDITPVAVANRAADAAALEGLVRLGDRVLGMPLLDGNRFELLDGGGAAYPRMIAAIEAAERSVGLCTYIFDNDEWGARFVEALVRAKARGVAVRVLIDGVGVRYSARPVHRRLRALGVPTALFLPTWAPALLPYLNLRNHRKILVVDGTVGFTGGMNIREEFARVSPPPAQDLHFLVEGPVVGQLSACFRDDWEFAARELLEGPAWFPALAPCGGVVARGVTDGPDENFDSLRGVLLGALSTARRTVRVMTPYFLPDGALITALNVAALRGVEVDIVLPEKGNLALVQWASTAQLWQNLERGCRIFLTPPPFDHSKLFVVDGGWTLLGSANWDPRSLRLNFEFNVECYDRDLGQRAEALVQSRIASARRLTLADVDARSVPVRLRDGLARLLSPYL